MRMAVSTVALLAMTGCLSVVDSAGRKANQPCSSRFTYPVIDTVLAVAATSVAVVAYSTQSEDSRTLRDPVVIGAGAVGVAETLSAGVGYLAVWFCRSWRADD